MDEKSWSGNIKIGLPLRAQAEWCRQDLRSSLFPYMGARKFSTFVEPVCQKPNFKVSYFCSVINWTHFFLSLTLLFLFLFPYLKNDLQAGCIILLKKTISICCLMLCLSRKSYSKMFSGVKKIHRNTYNVHNKLREYHYRHVSIILWNWTKYWFLHERYPCTKRVLKHSWVE